MSFFCMRGASQADSGRWVTCGVPATAVMHAAATLVVLSFG